MRREWIAGIFLMCLAFVYYKVAQDIPRSRLTDQIGAAAWPKILAISLVILSALLILTGALKKVSVSEEVFNKKKKEDLYAFKRAGGTVLIGVGYLITVSFVGYLIAVALLLFSMILYLGEPIQKKSIIIPIAGAIFFWLLFTVLFDIPMPLGVWSKFF